MGFDTGLFVVSFPAILNNCPTGPTDHFFSPHSYLSPGGGCVSYLHDTSNILLKKEKDVSMPSHSLSSLSIISFLKTSINKLQNSLAALAEFASPSKAKVKKEYEALVINISFMCLEPKVIGCG